MYVITEKRTYRGTFMNTFELSRILEDKVVRKYVVYFLPGPITITEVAKKVGVKNRSKLTNMIRNLHDYKVDKKQYRAKNSKPIQLAGSRLISDYMTALFKLNKDERDSLVTFISNVTIKEEIIDGKKIIKKEKTIEEFLLKNNKDLDQLLNKLILWIFKVDTITKMSNIIDPVYVSDFDSLLYEDYQSPDPERELDIRKKKLDLAVINRRKWKKARTLRQEIMDLEMAPRREKSELEIALTEFAKHNTKGFAFINKIIKSDITTSIGIKNLYELIYGNLKGYEKELKFRLAIYERLMKDDSLIYDPYTRIIQKRTDFRKRRI